MKYAYVTTFVYDAAVGPEKSGRVVQELKGRIKAQNGSAIVLHEMRFKANQDPYQIDRSWLPEAVDDFISWANANGFEFVLFDG